jgi:hypothetical protein
MDNSSTKSIVATIKDSINSNNISSSPTVFSSTPLASSPSSDSWLGSLFSVSITTWIIIFIILAFLGFNIFIYLAKGTQDITSFFTPIISKIASVFGAVSGEVVNNTATGGKAVVNATANVVDKGLTAVQNATEGTQGKKASSTVGGSSLSSEIPNSDVMQNNTLNKALNKTNAQQNIGQTKDYVADDSTSSIQKTQHKSGYCYIGEERGHRSCVRVGENDTCMSGDIFPTSEICINPSLRV